MSSYTQAATVALSETGGMNDESERHQGMGKSRGHKLKLIFTKVGGGNPPWEQWQLAPAVPSKGSDPTLLHRAATTVAAATSSSATQ